MSVSAFTPPKREADVADFEDDLAGRAVMASRRLPDGGKVLASSIRRSAATMPVRPSSNLTCVSMYWLGLAVVQRVDEHLIALADEAASDLARARQLAVVGVELLVQDQEAADLAAGEQSSSARSALTFSHAVADQLVDLRLLRQIGVAA